MADIQLLLEAERRGILPPEKAGLLNEARRRGLVPPPETAQAAGTETDAQESQSNSQERETSPEESGGVGRFLARAGADVVTGLRALPQLFVSGLTRDPLEGTGFESGQQPVQLPQVNDFVSQETAEYLAPRNDSEKLASTVTQNVAGVLGGVGAGKAIASVGGPAVQTVSRFLSANPTLQTVGAVTGGSSSELARRAGLGQVGQTVAGLAGSLTPSVALSTAQKVATGLNRTDAAQRLLDRGVDLTPGSLNPAGRIRQLEEGASSVGIVGPSIKEAQQNARSTFQRAAIQEGAAPGTAISQAEPAAMLDQAAKSFTPLYDAAKGFPASAQIVNQGANVPLSTAVTRAIRSRSILATDEQRKAVLGFVRDQLTKGVTTSDDLLNIRSSIRDKARAAKKAQGQEERAELLDAADDVITRALESQLPPDALRILRTADAKYGDYKTVESAVVRSKDRPGGFTPNDLSEAAAQSATSKGSYARGGGGPIRQLASDAREVLDARSPTTGARLLTFAPGAAVASAVDPVTGVALQGGLLAGSTLGAVTKTGRKLAAGNTDAQRFLKRQLASANIDVPLSYKQALANNVTMNASELLAKVTPARELIFLDPGSTPEQVALAKSAIASSEPESYKAMVREFLGDAYVNSGSVARDPRRIKAALPAGSPEAIDSLVSSLKALPAQALQPAQGPISQALKARSLANLRFLVSPADADEATRNAGLDLLTDTLLDPEKRAQLQRVGKVKDRERQFMLLGAIFAGENVERVAVSNSDLRAAR